MEERIATLLRDGEAAARTGQKAEARRKFRAVLAHDPVNVTALLWMAWLNDEPRASLVYVTRALTFEPHNPQAHAALHWARAVCRRAERRLVATIRQSGEEISTVLVAYLNRLGDLLFVLARYVNAQAGQKEVVWQQPS